MQEVQKWKEHINLKKDKNKKKTEKAYWKEESLFNLGITCSTLAEAWNFEHPSVITDATNQCLYFRPTNCRWRTVLRTHKKRVFGLHRTTIMRVCVLDYWLRLCTTPHKFRVFSTSYDIITNLLKRRGRIQKWTALILH